MAQNRLTISALTQSLAFGGSIRRHRWLRPIPSLFNLLLIYTFHPPLIIASPEYSPDISNAAVQVPLAIQLAAVEYDVVVIGAGLSGLEAARNIHKSGLSVLVLEAKDLIGGKTRSVSNDGNGFIELGAAWVNDTNQSEMWAMVQKYGLEAVIQRAEGLDCVQNKDKSVAHVPYGDTPVSGSTFLQMLFG